MKKIGLLTAIVGLLAAPSAFAQGTTVITITTNSSGGLTYMTNSPTASSGGGGLGGVINVGKVILANLEHASNWAFVPYGTVATAPRSAKLGGGRNLGGGALALYNFNQFVGTGVGIDYIGVVGSASKNRGNSSGSLTMVSANVELKLPIQPLAFTGWGWATNLTTTPFVYSGLGTPIGGSGGSGVVTHEGEGLNLDLFQLWGGEFSIGAAYIERQNAGPYSGNYFNPFLAWRKGF